MILSKVCGRPVGRVSPLGFDVPKPKVTMMGCNYETAFDVIILGTCLMA